MNEIFIKTEKLNPDCSKGSRRISPALTLASPLPAHSSADKLPGALHPTARVALVKQK